MSQAQAPGRDWVSQPGRRGAGPKSHPAHAALRWQDRAFSGLSLDCGAQWQEKSCPQARSSGSSKPLLVTWSKSITLFSLSFFLCQVETTPTSQGCCMDQEITMANHIYSFRNRHCSALHILTHVTPPHKITPACTEHEATTQ